MTVKLKLRMVGFPELLLDPDDPVDEPLLLPDELLPPDEPLLPLLPEELLLPDEPEPLLPELFLLVPAFDFALADAPPPEPPPPPESAEPPPLDWAPVVPEPL